MPLSLEDQERIAQTAFLRDVAATSYKTDQTLRAIAKILGRMETLLFVIAAVAVALFVKTFA